MFTEEVSIITPTKLNKHKDYSSVPVNNCMHKLDDSIVLKKILNLLYLPPG